MKDKIEWWQPCIGNSEYELVKEVLDSNYLNEGTVTEKFEKELANLLEVKHAITVTSGTAALFLALYSIGVRPGDEVIVPDLTFIATANAVTMCGAKAVLVDIEPHTLNMDPKALAVAITARTKAIIPVHISGRAANLSEIIRIASTKKISVIEDAAQSFMSKYNGKPLGTHGLMGCFSFSPNKTITTGQGGLIVTNDDNLNTTLHQLKDQGRAQRGTAGNDYHPVVGFNFKFTNLQAAIGLGQLQMLEKRLSRLKQIYSLYRELLTPIEGIQLLNFDITSGESPQWIDALIDNRDEFDTAMNQNNISCRCLYHPIHRQKPYFMDDKYFPICTTVSAKGIWLPSAFTLEDNDIKNICENITNFFKRHKP